MALATVVGFAVNADAAPGPNPVSLTGVNVDNTGNTIQATPVSPLTIQASTIVGGTVQTVGAGIINLNGAAQITGGALTNVAAGTINVAATDNVLGGAVSNAGTIAIGAGSLQLLGSAGSTYINSGKIVIGAGGGFPSSLTLNGNVSLNGGGSVVLSGSTSSLITGNGSSTLTNVDNTISGTGQIGGGSLRFINQGSVIASQPGGMLITGGALGTTNAGLFKVNAGETLNSTGVFTNFANNTLTGGTYQVFGTFTFDNASIHTNAATILLGGPAASIVDQNGHDALAAFSANAAAGNFTIRDGHDLTTPSAFSNAGTLAIGVGTTFEVGKGGTADYTQSHGTTTVNGSLTVHDAVINGGILTGSGTVVGNVENAGTITHYGVTTTFSITGNYVQSSSGTLDLTINGTGTGLYDRVIIGGSATFNGILNVNFGYAAAIGDTLQVIFFTSSSGSFAPSRIHVAGLSSDLKLFEFYNDNNLTLFVGPIVPNGQNVPEPSSIALLTLGLAGLGLHGFRRRKATRPG